MVGIFDPEWGLTLPSPIHKLDGIKENIPKTLNLFRKHLKKREAKVKVLENFKRTRLLTQNPVNIIDKAVLFKWTGLGEFFMPFYDYQCEKCKETFEVLQKVFDAPLTECEKCKGPLQKILNNMTLHLYGPGFHTTDNKRKYLK